MTRFFTSDLHLDHTNVIAYCDRPFADVGQMNAALVAAWNTVVMADDEVWVLGDLAMGRVEETLAVAKQLVGPGKAEEYAAAAASELEAERHIAATSLAIHAAINAADAVCGSRLGQRAAGEDHDQVLT